MAACLPTLVFYTKAFGVVRRGAKLDETRPLRQPAIMDREQHHHRASARVGRRPALIAQGLEIVQRLASPCVFIGNHMSILETFVLPCLIVPHRNVTFVVKESLITYPCSVM